MNRVVGVSFKQNSKIYFFNDNALKINDGDMVITETDRGLQLGCVVASDIMNKEVDDKMKKIVRVATPKNVMIFEKNKVDAFKALSKAKEISKKLNLNMNIIDANYTFDRNQLLFYFVSESRVDFRDMAKQLAFIYKTRIELRQVGVRDKAKQVSGIGQCGRELCCSCFLKDNLDSVTINMAKNQNIALNPSKINGQCGRLLCCLNYEDDVYTENRKDLPNVGDVVKTPNGEGKVVSIDILNKSYVVNVPDEGKIQISVKSE